MTNMEKKADLVVSQNHQYSHLSNRKMTCLKTVCFIVSKVVGVKSRAAPEWKGREQRKGKGSCQCAAPAAIIWAKTNSKIPNFFSLGITHNKSIQRAGRAQELREPVREQRKFRSLLLLRSEETKVKRETLRTWQRPLLKETKHSWIDRVDTGIQQRKNLEKFVIKKKNLESDTQSSKDTLIPQHYLPAVCHRVYICNNAARSKNTIASSSRFLRPRSRTAPKIAEQNKKNPQVPKNPTRTRHLLTSAALLPPFLPTRE
jgi:hypothetical protein